MDSEKRCDNLWKLLIWRNYVGSRFKKGKTNMLFLKNLKRLSATSVENGCIKFSAKLFEARIQKSQVPLKSIRSYSVILALLFMNRTLQNFQVLSCSNVCSVSVAVCRYGRAYGSSLWFLEKTWTTQAALYCCDMPDILRHWSFLCDARK